MTVLYMTADQQGSGKTSLCVTLVHDLRRRGKTAAVFKPLQAQPGPGGDSDAQAYHDLLGLPLTEWPVALAEDGLSPAVLDRISQEADRLSQEADVVVVEGQPPGPDGASTHIVEALEARVLAVVGYQPGLDVGGLATLREQFGERLLGSVINGLTRYQGSDASNGLLPSLSSEGLRPLGIIPEDRRMLSVTVVELASHLEGRFALGEELGDTLVEHYLVGGLGLDSGEAYFGLYENKAAIVRGDRPDIQMAALATPTACMVLTGGIEPIEYVRNEAELEEVPLVVVDADTLATMEALNTVTEKARFDHPAKLSRFGELVKEHVDLDAIYAGLGLEL